MSAGPPMRGALWKNVVLLVGFAGATFAGANALGLRLPTTADRMAVIRNGKARDEGGEQQQK